MPDSLKAGIDYVKKYKVIYSKSKTTKETIDLIIKKLNEYKEKYDR